MSHKHEWSICIISYECDFEARCECGAILDVDEMEHRLNAYEAKVTIVKRITPDIRPSDEGGLAQKMQKND